MMPLIPRSIELIVIATNLAVAIAAWTILSSAAGRSGLPPVTRRRVRIGLAVFFGAWLGAAMLLAPAPETLAARDRFYLSPLIPLFLIGPIGLGLLAIRRSPVVRRVLAAASLPAVIGVQLYRIIGTVFLVLLAQGRVPAHFALPAGWGDIAVGLTAPLVALALAREARGGRRLAAAWNIFGLLDLVIAVGMGTGFLAPLLAPELGTRVAPSAVMGVFPMILIPMFTVTVSVMLHLIALGRLWHDVGLGSEVTPRADRVTV